jgi:hypothetical protein
MKKQQEEIRRKREEERRQMELNMQNNDILGNGGTVRERLIKAAKNFENIKKEVNKINQNNGLISKTEKISIKINQEIGKVTSIEDIDKCSKILADILNEIKQGNHKEFYLYSCYTILKIIIKRISSIIDITKNYLNHCYFSRIIEKINSRTLTFMFFQIISNTCPYIIPALNIIPNKNKDSRTKETLEENSTKNLNIEYFYFIFLYLNINKYIDIIEDYITNMEQLPTNEINYLIGNSFVSFIDVFGNYIKKNKSAWFPSIINVKNKIKKVLENQNKTTKNPSMKNIINQILFSLDFYIGTVNKNEYTNFIKEISTQRI